MRTVTRAQGFTLVECLIAMVVLSIGLMGMASLILESLRNGHSALLRTQAVNLVTDMAERIRANPSAGAAAACEADTPAGGELADWQDAALLLLPLVEGPCAANVEYAPPAAADQPARFRISVTWIERGTPDPLTYRSDLLVAP